MQDILNYDGKSKEYIMTNKYNENKYLLQTSSNNRYFYGLHDNFIDLKKEMKAMIKSQQSILDFNLNLLNSLLTQGFRSEAVIVGAIQNDRGVIPVVIKFNNEDFSRV